MDWGITPEYINENWTDELFHLMFKARKERILRQQDSGKQPGSLVNRVSSEELLAKMARGGTETKTVKV